MTDRSVARVVVLFALLLSLPGALAWKEASADTSTPVPDSGTPIISVAPTNVPTVVPTAVDWPTVTQERSSPVATSVEVPTAAPTWAETSLPTVGQPTAPAATPTQSPAQSVPQPVSTLTPPTIAWPSPAQLREDAFLRWGNGIPSTVRRWAFLIVPAAKKYHLDPNLVAAVMTMESNGDPLAWSSADARGLMQILHGPWDPRTNVFEGARTLSGLWDRYADWTLVLAAYNAGPGAVDEYGGVPPYRETRDYVIIVGYLWDLYSHRKLSLHRRSLYRKSLDDLQRFAGQRRKVKRLATIARIPIDPLTPCSGSTCGALPGDLTYETSDPFWPFGGAPDPLQMVGPYARAP